jgi:hypothetical protein
MNAETIEAKIKFMIAATFCFTVVCMVTLSMFSLVFVPQPMSGIAPADKQFFYLLSDMSKYILGSLGTLLAIKGKDIVQDMMKKEPENDPPASTDGSREQDSGQSASK